MTVAVNAEVDNRRGALLLVLAAVAFTGEVVAVRLLDDGATSGQIVFARGFVQLLVVGAWIALRQPGLVRTSRPGLHLARGLTSLVCWLLYYRSFQALDLALATTLTFTSSLFAVALAPLILSERVGPARWLLTLLGFVGVALASGPTAVSVDPAVLLGLGAAFASAVLILMNRILARTEQTATIMFWIAVVACIGTAPVAALDWQPLDAGALILLALSGCGGTLGMMLTIEAYRVGEVSALAPFPYVRIVFAIVAGVALFGETLSLAGIAGAAIIVGCALAVRVLK
ncbi:multidrug transporter [Primorskyibacter flagellatus]|uniref:Multidrug transporter n=1 Tax=Primorskyibacter flagellatus TaxID=1387277 RepID=A0A916ZVE3_9RHOB|nr:DMT family transporter [Primorskyibacter flagellatus]GGE15843.1 multidrug transporter [Primorskyibacter flagellatus]